MRQELSNKRRSIHAQILIVVSTSLAIALLLAGLALYQQQYRDKELGLLEDLRFSGELLANRTIAAMVFNDYAAAKVNISSGRFIPSVTQVCIFDQQRALVSDFLRTEKTPACEQWLRNSTIKTQQEIDRQQAWVVVPIADAGVTLGYLKIMATTTLFKSKVERNLIAVFLILSAAMILALWLGSKLLRRTLTPLHALSNDVKALTQNPFADLRPTKYFNDEIGDLVDTFNHMLNTLMTEHVSLQSSEKRFRTLAENAPIGIYLKNSKGELIYTNKKWSEITGHPTGGDALQFDLGVSNDDKSLYQTMQDHAIYEHRPDTLEYSYTPPGSESPLTLMEYIAPVLSSDTSKPHETINLIGSILDVTELKQAQTELERLALYDPLTSLPNRRFFQDHLHYQIATSSKHRLSFAVLMIDLDDFKRVNDSMGHDAGDYLLKVISQRLHDNCFTEDVVSRLGGDEFVILLDNNSRVVIDHVVEKLQKAINAPVTFHNRTIEIRSSIGVAIFPEHGNSSSDLMKNADIALYRAKALGRNCMVYFSSELDQAIQARVALESKLQEALKNNGLSLALQPQIDALTQKPTWCEALVRWYDAESGFVPPSQFIPVAEESGLIVEVGNWVLQETCRLWSLHGEQLQAMGIAGISVNLSPRQFYASNLIQTILDTLEAYGVQPTNIAFEITESLVMEDVHQAIATLQELRSKGFRISMDDFGTGYSSLSYLKQFTIDYLKIDKSFVDGLPNDANDMAITSAIIAMAKQLDIGIVAEGIETEEQMWVLSEQGCRFMQGYYFSKPIAIEQLLALSWD